jgi:hypothetical protein
MDRMETALVPVGQLQVVPVTAGFPTRHPPAVDVAPPYPVPGSVPSYAPPNVVSGAEEFQQKLIVPCAQFEPSTFIVIVLHPVPVGQLHPPPLTRGFPTAQV